MALRSVPKMACADTRVDAEAVSAIPPDLAGCARLACGCSCVWPWRVHTGETTSLTNQCRNGRACSSLIARGGGLPIGVTLKYMTVDEICLLTVYRGMREAQNVMSDFTAEDILTTRQIATD